jgi:hypothetical protein
MIVCGVAPPSGGAAEPFGRTGSFVGVGVRRVMVDDDRRLSSPVRAFALVGFRRPAEPS